MTDNALEFHFSAIHVLISVYVLDKFIDLYIYIYIYVHSFSKGFNSILIYIIYVPSFSSIHLKNTV